jgi:hypothetical protein
MLNSLSGYGLLSIWTKLLEKKIGKNFRICTDWIVNTVVQHQMAQMCRLIFASRLMVTVTIEIMQH